MNKSFLYILLLFSGVGFAQETISELLKKHNSKTIPYMSVQELAMPKTDAIILDARELFEYKTSHLKHAIHVGYNTFNIDSVTQKLLDKNSKTVVYCSIGIRSENIAKKLKKAGYKNVYNLYGGIFEWKNNNFKVYDSEEQETENVHTFNQHWSKWLKKGYKIYD
ncbi:rhodanese-like domain-containing protein [Flaviramulus sp. BrNp1-15]|uniref:rhodanese-like domain-containing protein n=1 Tax=Flaviramulus sp. BrNp1-15 TaxID=2916754 RepID=UPI001EE7FDED|nr:rhodanese-like domain-containing protein [Flaviramulus sp. BrNp1-15]ULC60150.1 rhodanese-like domain-containing protein [Flaviramulus sp. BrNp1-15]